MQGGEFEGFFVPSSGFTAFFDDLSKIVEEALADTPDFIDRGAPPFSEFMEWSARRGYYFQYLLDEQGDPVPAPNTHEGRMASARLLSNGKKRRVALTIWHHRGRRIEVSTAFLAFNHDLTGLPGTPPVLWETMVFSEYGCPNLQQRYTSKRDAIAGHRRMVASIKEHLRYGHRQPPSVRRRRVARLRMAAGESVTGKRGEPWLSR